MIKVAGYCRVSTDKSDQSNSFAAQKRYFAEYIGRNPHWELYEIYADEGITGTSTKKRAQFNRLMNDAYAGRFGLILTKEVSRFSRNILDTIAYTRELRAMGIGVIFVSDRINTLEPESEMLLSYLAAQSQEESRRTSVRVVWGQTRQMEKGVVFGRSLLGYDVKAGILTVNPEGAEIVRLIFHKYALEQASAGNIADFLVEKGIPTYRGGRWTSKAVIKILHNEKYVGDLVQKKTYTPDYLTHEKKSNKGQVPMIVIANHHEPIISREIWDMAQERLRRNNKHGAQMSGHSNRYVFSGKIKCGQCGSSFVGRFQSLKDGTKIRQWRCGTATAHGRTGCDVGRLVRDDDAIQMLKTALANLSVDRDDLIGNVTELALEAIASGQTAVREDPKRLLQELERVRQKREMMMDAYFSREISREDMISFTEKYDRQQNNLQKRLEEAKNRKDQNLDSAGLRSRIQSELSAILKGETESEVFYKAILESLTVFQDRHMELRLNRLPQVFHFLG